MFIGIGSDGLLLAVSKLLTSNLGNEVNVNMKYVRNNPRTVMQASFFSFIILSHSVYLMLGFLWLVEESSI